MTKREIHNELRPDYYLTSSQEEAIQVARATVLDSKIDVELTISSVRDQLNAKLLLALNLEGHTSFYTVDRQGKLEQHKKEGRDQE